MLEYAGSQRAGRAAARRSDAVDLGDLVRGADWILIGAVAAVVGLGLWAVADITRFDVPGRPHYYLARQAAYAAVGVVCLVFATLLDPDLYRRYWRIVYGGISALIAVVFVGGPIVGFFKFQPSEFGKLLIVLAVAGFLAERSKQLHESRTTLAAIGLMLVPTLLVFVQPDLGTALVYGAALFAVLFVAGTPWTHLAALVVTVAFVASAVLWILPSVNVNLLQPYQRDRVTQWVHPSSDPAGATYNVTQSMTAIGAGGYRGRGPQGATQTNLGYVPENHTDFVFSSYAEERGFLGASLLLALYLLVVWRGIRVVTVARDLFSAIVAGGIVFALLFQIFVNVGMTMGIAPITGIPLPFVSVGGSSMIANLAAMGVLLSIHARGRAARSRRRGS
jgi:rod shape determining protein RodA